MDRNPLCVAETIRRILFVGLVLAATGVFLSGCSSRYGRLQRDAEVTRMFHSGEVLPNYQYYTARFQRIPYGIVAIKNTYSLRSSYWKPIDLTPSMLDQITYRMNTVYSLEPRGAWIVDPDGRRVGIWYSSRNWTKVKVEEDNEVMIVPPKPPDLSGMR